MKKCRCKNKHCLDISKSAWCDLNTKDGTLKLHDMCPKPKCKSPKLVTFTPNQFQLEGTGFKNSK